MKPTELIDILIIAGATFGFYSALSSILKRIMPGRKERIVIQVIEKKKKPPKINESNLITTYDHKHKIVKIEPSFQWKFLDLIMRTQKIISLGFLLGINKTKRIYKIEFDPKEKITLKEKMSLIETQISSLK